PDVKVIKKRIEDLITRDYLERDKENPNVFRIHGSLILGSITNKTFCVAKSNSRSLVRREQHHAATRSSPIALGEAMYPDAMRLFASAIKPLPT
ncbi:hypothetical protein M8C21_000335, partial [Ambrosia artemisiifolia]